MNANRLWIIGAALAVVAILVLGWLVGVSPKVAEAQLAASDQATVDAQNAAHEGRLVVLREQFANLDPMKRELEEFHATIPDDPDVEDFIDYVKATADATGVTISTITVVEPTDADTTAPAAGATAGTTGGATSTEGTTDPAPAPAPAAADVGFFAISVTIDVEGPPESVVQFVRGLQAAERIYFVSDFTYSAGSTGERGGSLGGYLFVLRGAEVTEAPVE